MKIFLNILFATLLVALFAPLSIKAQCQNDVVAPVWTNCPSNAILATDNGCQPYRWVAPTLSDNCPGRIDTLNTNTNYNGACIPSNTFINVVYLARDQSGNVGVCQFTISVIPTACAGETMSPDISGCPSDIITTSKNAHCVPVTWTPPTVIDNCDQIPTLTSNYLNGSCFNVGTTKVIYRATDVSGNTSTCSFTVIVNEVKSFNGNLISNFDFESSTTGFTDLGNSTITTDAYSGLSAIIIGTGVGGVSFTQNIIPNGEYTFKAYSKATNQVSSANLSMKFLDIDENVIANSETTSDITSASYIQQSVTGTAPSNAVYIQLSALKNNNKGYITTDNWALTETQPNAAPFFGNLIPNFGFESDFVGYDNLVNPTITTTGARSGRKAAKVDNSLLGGLGFTIDVDPGATYTFQSYNKVSNSGRCDVGLKFYDINAQPINNSEVKVKVTCSNFTPTNVTATAPSNAVYVRAYASKSNNSGTFITDDWSCKKTLPATSPSGGGTSTCTYDPTKCYKIVNVASGKVIQVKNWSNSNNALIDQFSYLGQNNQKWKIVPTTSNYVKFVNAYTGKYLSNQSENDDDDHDGGDNNDDDDHDDQSNKNCYQYSSYASKKSDWRIDCQQDGTVLVKHKYSNRNLDVKNGSGSLRDGGKIVIHSYDHTPSQKWQIVEVPCENYSYSVALRNPQQTESQEKTEATTRTNGQGEVGSIKANNGKAQTTTKTLNVSDEDVSNPLFEKTTESGKAKIYPNPTSAVINLNISSYQDKTLDVQLLNMMGTQVKTKKVDAHSAQTLEIDVNDLPSGTYILVIKSTNTIGLTDQIQRINVIR